MILWWISSACMPERCKTPLAAANFANLKQNISNIFAANQKPKKKKNKTNFSTWVKQCVASMWRADEPTFWRSLGLFFFSIALTFRTICGKFSKCWQLFSSSTMKIKLDAHSNWKHQQLFESRVESSNNNNTNNNGNTSRCAEFYCCIAALASPSHSIQFRFPFPTHCL